MAPHRKIITFCLLFGVLTSCGPMDETSRERNSKEREEEAYEAREEYQKLTERYQKLVGEYRGTLVGVSGRRQIAILKIWLVREVINVPGSLEPIEAAVLKGSIVYYEPGEDPGAALPLGSFSSGSFGEEQGILSLTGQTITLSGSFSDGRIRGTISAQFAASEIDVTRIER